MEPLAALQDSEKSFTTTSLSLKVTVPKRNKQQWQKGPCKVFFAMRLYSQRYNFTPASQRHDGVGRKWTSPHPKHCRCRKVWVGEVLPKFAGIKKRKGYREMLLPFNTDDVNLPNILEQCMKRVLGIKRKLLKNGKTLKHYITLSSCRRSSTRIMPLSSYQRNWGRTLESSVDSTFRQLAS